ncbi:hypothetical protein F5H01DRAFT_330093 [Linnemannia elongata]|nr:hypothetical protein F5H01DRAFT_330093 [Linnemannia elongata]
MKAALPLLPQRPCTLSVTLTLTQQRHPPLGRHLGCVQQCSLCPLWSHCPFICQGTGLQKFGPASHRRCPRCHTGCCCSRPIDREGTLTGFSSTDVARLASGISQRPLHTNFQRHHCRRQR